MSTFHSLKIKEVRRETPSAVSIAFDIPALLAGISKAIDTADGVSLLTS